MKNSLTTLFVFLSLLTFISISNTSAQDDPAKEPEQTFDGLKFRNIGPALMSGRIADIAIHPENDNIWIIAAGSGGVWKTTNSGTTWEPIFDKQSSFSIGCVTIDHSNPNIVWVGTGENVGGRHVGFGDGIYRSGNGGLTWKNMGLKNSEHISKIIVHPTNSNIIWVAAQGPLWSKGGERGLYKSIDGGLTWNKTLGDDEWTGVTDIVIDPRNPKLLYAATWERHRNVAAYIGGGPGSALYSSMDGGEKWEKLSNGLPAEEMGKIGLAISPQNPDVVYAVIELERRKGGFYRTTDKGASWSKMSETVSGATGPHYYQELYASPHKFDRIYLADVRMQVSEDGGKTFSRMPEKYKHSDNHALAFRADDPNYLLVGTDGGLYESFDLTQNWRFISNLPITQFYKVAVDDAEPFYNIYGGTQDNSTQGGPSRTDNKHGIRNSDWFLTLGGDGHQPATEPGNPDIMYSESQEGYIFRIDRKTGEIVFIQPQPDAGEAFERYNWDAPILVSPHAPTRLYFASQRVWKSENRGDSWTAISGDLTKNQERMSLPIDGKRWSWDSSWDIYAMSTYNTISALAESPVQEGLIYAGTDDGIIQVTEDGGTNWRKIMVNDLPDVPETAFVNDIKADLFDANTVYIALDNHKFGDFNPYLYKSTNKGKTWVSIKGNIPGRTMVWRLVQDYIKPELLFAATEGGIYFTPDGGKKWEKLTGGIPTISFRDLTIQRRENDLVAASFGRGFFVFDDYSVLREISPAQMQQEATLFATRKAWWYAERAVLGDGEKADQGASFHTAPNPPFGAVFTYYLSKEYKTKKQIRQDLEKDLKKANKNIPFQGWENIEKEESEEKPVVLLTVKDTDGNIVRRIESKATKGFHRIAWDLRYPATEAIDQNKKIENTEERIPKGNMAPPGTYSVTLWKKIDGVLTQLSEPQKFEVIPLRKGALEGSSIDQIAAFWHDIENINKDLSAFKITLKNAHAKTDAMIKAISLSEITPGELDKKIYDIKQSLLNLDEKLNGSKAKNSIGEKNFPNVNDRINMAATSTSNLTYGATTAQVHSLEIGKAEFQIIKNELDTIMNNSLPEIEKALVNAGAPLIR